MKRILLLMMACMLLMPTAWAEGENTLLRHAVELGRALDALAEDGEAHRQFTHEAEVLAILQSYGEGSHEEPCEMREIMLDELMPKLKLDLSDLTDAGRRQVQNLMPGTIMQSLVNSYGLNQVVASTIVHAESTFAAEDVSGCGMWVMTYEEAAPIGIAWYAENGAVHMKAAFLPEAVTQLEGLAVSTRVVAAARPGLDAYAASLAEELQQLAGNRAYLEILGLSPEVMDVVRDYAAEDNCTPRLVLCALTDDAQEANMKLTQQIGYLGDVCLAAAGAMHATVIFADPDATGTGLYLFLYEDGVPVVVQWQGENGAYHLSASFQPGELLFACQSAEDASAWAESIGLTLNFQPPGVMLLP